mmetsp:Transcript_31851/g.98393  ORF Transcript_31851/g.98393 Transcript_31851/m.98393 type:complete len:80 (+) Transcript_31851:2802-3041(+)
MRTPGCIYCRALTSCYQRNVEDLKTVCLLPLHAPGILLSYKTKAGADLHPCEPEPDQYVLSRKSQMGLWIKRDLHPRGL